MSPQSFFADGTEFIEPIECDICGESAYLILRAPHPDIRSIEIQTFQCPKCGHRTRQSVTP
jgi:C4-type Zn-finger protein